MWRMHWFTSEILQSLVENRPDHAAALAVQSQKVLVQLAIDHGSWDTAMLLWPGEDPLAGEEFGGDEEEMRRVYGYRKAVQELKTKHSRLETPEGGDEVDETTAGRRKGGRGRGAGRGKGDGPSAPA